MKFQQPNITEKEVEFVADCIRKGYLTTGVIADQFEGMFHDMFGYDYCVVTNSGTSAMHLALIAMGVGPGDEVIVTPYSMIATVNVILAVGATPVFCDIERDTYNLDPTKIKNVLTEKTKAILPASIFGVPCNVKAMRAEIPQNVQILEDSIEALGAMRDGHYVGKDADAAAFGFFPNKQITTCEGGMLVTDRKEIADKVRRLSRHGVMNGDLSYQSMGYNMRLSDVHCALGVVQLGRLQEMQEAMLTSKRLLDARFRGYRKQVTPDGYKSTEFIYGIELPPQVEKEEFILDMEALGIPIKPYFNVMHLFAHTRPYHKNPLPVAEEVGRRTVALPYHYCLTSMEVDMVWDAFCTVTGAFRW